MRLYFEPDLEKKLGAIAKVIGVGQSEYSGDYTTASGSFLPPFSFNEEEELHDGSNPAAVIKHSSGNQQNLLTQNNGADEPLNLSNISFNETGSPINQTMNSDKNEESKESVNSSKSQTNENNTDYPSAQNVSKLRKASTFADKKL